MVSLELITAEVLSTLPRLVRRGLMTCMRADEAANDLMAALLRRLPTLPLTAEMWCMRRNSRRTTSAT